MSVARSKVPDLRVLVVESTVAPCCLARVVVGVDPVVPVSGLGKAELPVRAGCWVELVSVSVCLCAGWVLVLFLGLGCCLSGVFASLRGNLPQKSATCCTTSRSCTL